jgi:carbamoyl-phosphate synthase large subunit
MPKRTDLQSILLLGSGPIVIGQACEFDYSGVQACKSLKAEGYRVILVNSNPATIMTDPEFSDRTYIEPIDADTVAKIIAAERPDALLPTLGGQTALNVSMQLFQQGVLQQHGVEMIGASAEAIHTAEDRERFRETMRRIGLEVPRSTLARSWEEAKEQMKAIGLPCVIRPAYTLGGEGGGIAYNQEEFETIARRGIEASMIHEILIEESVIGWKEFELEVMRDRKDNVVVICSIENFDPMGVHTGDSITVAPAQTLTDKEYQRMRDAAIAVIRAIGVDTGGSNIQFAVEPETGRMVVIEMNPRVSRSSALASKATGFPIAKFAAKLAVGYTLDEIPNDITRKTPACFEPTIDYCVVKIPRWTFEKFPLADPTLTTHMKSVGEVMALGRTFPEALQKALRSLEVSRLGLGGESVEELPSPVSETDHQTIRRMLSRPTAERMRFLRMAYLLGWPTEEIHKLTRIDPWFLKQIEELVVIEQRCRSHASLPEVPADLLRQAKRWGFSDRQLASFWKTTDVQVRSYRQKRGVEPVYKLVDTCAAEFEAATPYYYSSYESEDESRKSDRPKVVILGGGPNRIGQGIEFDYCCVHASFALKEMDYETIMINSNPETVSTDYDTSDLLYFEPLTVEDVLNVWESQKPLGMIVQFGGQTPLNLARRLQAQGVRIIGTAVDRIDEAEDREKFRRILRDLKLNYPDSGIANNPEEAMAVAEEVGYPVLVRPSYVLGGRAMEIVYDRESLQTYMRQVVEASPERPIQIDRFLEEAIELDVDAVSDGRRTVIGGIMEHIEEAGIHSGDSCCVLPAHSIGDAILEEIRNATQALARKLEVRGLMNVQFAVKGTRVYVLEVNPRASRTVPFVSKAIGVPLAKVATQVMMGRTLEELGYTQEIIPPYFSVKEPVFPFARFPGVDILLGPEMRSTGEVMGIDTNLGCALAKAKRGASQRLPKEGKVFISVKDADKRTVLFIAKQLVDLGFELCATSGTHKVLQRSGIPSQHVCKLNAGRPNVLDIITNREVGLIINTPSGKDPRADEALIRTKAVALGIPCITTLSAAAAVVSGIEAVIRRGLSVRALQDYHAPASSPRAATTPAV